MPSALVCEDDHAIRTLVERFLCRQGFVAETAAHGGRALPVPARRHDDAIIPDLRTPPFTGEASIRHIERERRGLLPREVVTTAATRSAQEVTPQTAGAIVTSPSPPQLGARSAA